ncbi:hypothetical protein AD933_09440 [Acetobacter malorum]|uniref:Uncharacterized protein n=1 Tax=Acetobacter malorum TaxID=178901 RepID=A0A149URD0_9PROT|nr:hypothetical protein [Acetobacter malorum]KXV15195.1 hypothetical protein AD933_09440 [Acetobacter malorum]KXV70296.1 hypothetical protein AD951_03275 [Acetobacter malorum]
MNDKASEFKIAMIAPSRIGKTSLVTAVLQDTKELLSGTPLSIRPADAKTSARINQHANQLRGSLREREFDAGAMSGTEASFEFNLSLNSPGQEENGLNLKLLDFPGGWLPNLLHGEGSEEQRKCAAFVRQASVLLLVVDASLIMEASSSREKRAIDSILNIAETEEIVEEWTKARHEVPTEPALVIICPVKCESYFADNGGSRDKSEELYQKIWQLYGNLVDTIIAEDPGEIEILYMPVDTVGCVEFSHADWADLDTTMPLFRPSFCVRGLSKQKVLGANDILLAVAKQIIHYQEKHKRKMAEISAEKAKEATQQAKNKGFWESIASIFVDTASDKAAKAARENADLAIKNATSTAELMQALANKKFGSRVKVISTSEAN